ncbi:DUF1287 domain-containing protein [Altererythrobacter sp. ZODW24]|uniref:DUF1287 domain-containing protein n=1 Tax=Altererythrobacter sp. ZODW24 TaxID=2185142 RepID=UPI00196674AA|nr:DUF1287 domain-containing protein [Altererythrobacter sp. ZODW24]
MITQAHIHRRQFMSGLALGALLLPSCSNATQALPPEVDEPATDRASQLIAAARKQIGVTVSYDPAYNGMSYPGGDVPRSRGVCTDVVIRAYRDAFDIDLQKLVHEDMKANFERYPKNWQLRSTDRNIDHRRVPNLQTFLTRQGAALPISSDPADWSPGDIFTSKVGGKFPHIGIVSKRLANDDLLAVHNIGSGAREEAVVFAHKLDGHFRWRV